MGPDIEVADAGPVGQRQGQRWRATLLAPADLQQMGDGAGAEGIAREGGGDRGGELRLTLSKNCATWWDCM